MSLIRCPSLTKDGLSYDVAKLFTPHSTQTHYECSCPAFRHGRDCKHIKIVRFADESVEKCRHGHQHNLDGLCRQCFVVVLAAAARKVKRRYKPKANRIIKEKT